jgi:transposase
MPSIVGGLDIHRKQITFGYLDLVSGEVSCGQVAPADREHFRSWLARFENPAGSRSRPRRAPAGGM